MVNIKLELDAKDDLKQIQKYISRNSIYYANKTIEGIIEKIKYLSTFPYMGRKIPEYDNKKF